MSLTPLPDVQFATADTYTSGPYSGQSNKVAPSGALVVSGLVPSTQLPAPRLNYKLHELARAALLALDQPAFTWRAFTAFADSTLINYGWGSPYYQRVWIADSHIVVDRDMPGTHGRISYAKLYGGLGIDNVSAAWTSPADGAFTSNFAGTLHPAGPEQSNLVVSYQNGSMLGLLFSNAAQTAVNGGAPFAGTPTLLAGISFGGTFYLHQQTGTSTIPWTFSTATLIGGGGGSWTSGSALVRSESPGVASAVVYKPASAAFTARYVLLHVNGTTAAVRTGASTWVEAALGGSARACIGAYNAALASFLVCGSDGTFTVGDESGLNWTTVTVTDLATAAVSIQAHARGFVVATGGGSPVLYYVTLDQKNNWYARRIPLQTPVSGGNAWWLATDRGRVLALRQGLQSGGTQALEYWVSDCSPLLTDSVTGT